MITCFRSPITLTALVASAQLAVSGVSFSCNVHAAGAAGQRRTAVLVAVGEIVKATGNTTGGSTVTRKLFVALR
jgi:hypothetical protein